MYFRGLRQALQFVGKPGLNGSGEEQALENADVFLGCDVVHPDGPRQFRSSSRAVPNALPICAASAAFSQSARFALHRERRVERSLGCNLHTSPVCGSTFCGQYLGISTGKDGSHQIVADDGFSTLSLILKGVAQEAASGGSDFALRKRKQSNDLHSACERVCHPWQRHEVS